LNDTLCMQNEVYNAMAQKGWYPAQQAEQQQIEQAKQKFSQASSQS
ncbi:MAG: spore coat protein, partial [Turicibacter sp.]|nr:spore coat protein [Turicibacter sp.]